MGFFTFGYWNFFVTRQSSEDSSDLLRDFCFLPVFWPHGGLARPVSAFQRGSPQARPGCKMLLLDCQP